MKIASALKDCVRKLGLVWAIDVQFRQTRLGELSCCPIAMLHAPVKDVRRCAAILTFTFKRLKFFELFRFYIRRPQCEIYGFYRMLQIILPSFHATLTKILLSANFYNAILVVRLASVDGRSRFES